MANPDEILAFWLDETGPVGWYTGGEELDQKIRDRFGDDYNRACDGALSLWLTYPTGTLAYIVLTDQFPRNMFRGTAKAFDTDGIARAASKVAISRGWDMRIDEPRAIVVGGEAICRQPQQKCHQQFRFPRQYFFPPVSSAVRSGRATRPATMR